MAAHLSVDMSPVLYLLHQEPQSSDELRSQFCEFSGESRSYILLRRSGLLCGRNGVKNNCKFRF